MLSTVQSFSRDFAQSLSRDSAQCFSRDSASFSRDSALGVRRGGSAGEGGGGGPSVTFGSLRLRWVLTFHSESSKQKHNSFWGLF